MEGGGEAQEAHPGVREAGKGGLEGAGAREEGWACGAREEGWTRSLWEGKDEGGALDLG